MGGAFFENAWKDVRYCLRTMAKSPMFAMTAVLTLALGIGGNTAMFSVIRAVLLKPLEYREPDRLVRIWLDDSMHNRDGSFTLLRLEDMRKTAQSFDGIGAYLKFKEDVSLSGQGRPEALKSARVSANFLDVLGVKPLFGRSFLAEEDKRGGPAVAMISAGLWKRRFGGDSQIAGKTMVLNSTPYTVIGVLPEGFAFPFIDTDVWLTRPSEWSLIPQRAWPFVSLLAGFARLKPQVTFERAQAEMDVLNRRYLRAHPERTDAKAGATISLPPLKEQLVSKVRLTLWTLFGAVGFVLLIACANIASLLLARASSRSREFAVRAAVGASRGRLIGQLLVESLVLAAMGGALGCLLAKWVSAGIKHVTAVNLPRAGDIQLDGTVLGFTLALSIVTGVLFGLFPSLKMSRPDVADALRASGATAGQAGSGRRRVFGLSTRAVLVIGQISLSIVLLIGATLLIKSYARLHAVEPGFQPANVLTMKIALAPTTYDTSEKKFVFFRELARRAGNVPGVRDAAVAMSIPTTLDWLGTNVLIEGQAAVDASQQGSARVQSVTPGYFRTLKIPLRRGREFTEYDNTPGAPGVVVINESFARRFWPTYPLGVNPVGQHLGEGLDRTGWMEIVGIVGDVHEGDLARESGSEFYVPTIVHSPQTAYLAVRTQGDPLGFASAMRSEVAAIDSNQPVSDVRTMEAVLDATLGERRLTMLLLGSFAAVAVILAVVGMYGVIAYSVAQRTQEVGIRRALGAQQGDILQLVLMQGLGLALAGIVMGVGGGLALTRVMKSLLFQVSATDPATFVGIALLFVVVALVASYLPARKAARIDPMNALRAG
ncbi:MAG: ABC transporter permease [Acidobacteriaceae bacterium]|nr:ABC transporter permease [Acidobacteriaceae bacterium]